MQAYFLTGSNNFAIRTQPFVSGSTITLLLQNMYTLANTTSSINNYSYDPYESLLQWTASISGAVISAEYRSTIVNGTTELWNGSIQVYETESANYNYRNQNTQYKSHISANEYIIMN
jgi:hypothetical protein